MRNCCAGRRSGCLTFKVIDQVGQHSTAFGMVSSPPIVLFDFVFPRTLTSSGSADSCAKLKTRCPKPPPLLQP